MAIDLENVSVVATPQLHAHSCKVEQLTNCICVSQTLGYVTLSFDLVIALSCVLPPLSAVPCLSMCRKWRSGRCRVARYSR